MISALTAFESTASTLKGRSMTRCPPSAPNASGERPSRTVNQKRDPRPMSLSTPRSPSMIVTSSLTIDRPRPVPPRERVIDASTWWKDSKIRACCSASMPIPVSVTEQWSVAPSAFASASDISIRISPRSVNFTALPTRLSSTCRNREGSPVR